jgi:hypothetical protein
MAASDSKPELFDRAQRAEQRGNRDVRDLWERYRSHREHVTAEILALAPASGGRLCLLGAGNANDLDLEALAARFDELHLVDIDPAALSRATGRQSPAVRTRLRSHAPVDLSGLYHQLGRAPLPPSDALAAAGAIEVLRQLPGSFDVVASCCVLSQMSWALEQLVVGPAHGQREQPAQAALAVLQQVLVRVHLRTMLGLITPATGVALLVADMVSSRTYPLDELPPDEDLRALTDTLAAQRVAFPVCNPELVRQIIRRDGELASVCQPPVMGQPWLWEGPKQLRYLVYPFVLRRRP